MKFFRKTSGIKPVDTVFEDVYRILNGLNTLSGSASSSGGFIITEIGGLACLVHNQSGVVLPEGYLVRASEYSTLRSVTLARENDFDVPGIVYKEIPVNALGYMVFAGPCDVWFNANGSFARGYVQMSRDYSTGNDDTGKAQCGNVDDPDSIAVLGYVFQTRSGEGLARCIKTR